MSPSLMIRPGRADDVTELYRLVGMLADSLDDRDNYFSTPESFTRYGFGPRPLFHSLLAFERDDAVGAGAGAEEGRAVAACVFLPDFSTWLARPGVYILDLIVEPSQRDAGVGRALLAGAAEWGRREWDADYLILSVERTNEAAIGFYHRLGFSINDDVRVMVHYDLGDLTSDLTG